MITAEELADQIKSGEYQPNLDQPTLAVARLAGSLIHHIETARRHLVKGDTLAADMALDDAIAAYDQWEERNDAD